MHEDDMLLGYFTPEQLAGIRRTDGTDFMRPGQVGDFRGIPIYVKRDIARPRSKKHPKYSRDEMLTGLARIRKETRARALS